MKRKTIKNEVEISGIGLHKGQEIKLTLKSNEDNGEIGRGIIFKRIDITDKDNVIKVDYRNLFDLERGTNIRNKDEVKVHTIEHFMSALFVSGITDILVEINGNELPILDGSSIQFMEKLKEAGIKELESEIEPIVIKEPIIFSQEKDGKHVIALPYDDFKISYTIDFNHSFLKSQYFEINVNLEEYIEKIVNILENISPDIIIHRMTGDGNRDTLIAPLWSLKKVDVLNSIQKLLKERNSYQGKMYKNVFK